MMGKKVEITDKDATVVITLAIEAKYVAAFIRDWEEIEQKLQEQAGITSAILTLPKTEITTIDLMEG